MGACLATAGVTSAAHTFFQSVEGMFHPGLPDLFEALLVIRAPAHAIQVLWNDRVISFRQRKPIDWLVAIIAGVCPYCQANLRPDGTTKLFHVLNITDYNIGAVHEVWQSGAEGMLHG